MKKESMVTRVWASIRKSSLLILALAIFAGGSYWLAEFFAVRGAAQPTVEVTPFTLVLNLYDFTHGPSELFAGQKTIARRFDGSTAEVGPFLGRDGRQFGLTSRQLTFAADGHVMTIVDDAKSKATWPPLTGDRLASWLNSFTQPPKDCLSFGQLDGSAIVSGEDVDVIKWPPIGGHTIVNWADPKLGCEPIQYEIRQPQADGSMMVVFAGRLASLKFGEPASSLFDEELGYAEMPPSQLLQTELAKIGKPMNDAVIKEGQRLDKVYFGQTSQLSRTPPSKGSAR